MHLPSTIARRLMHPKRRAALASAQAVPQAAVVAGSKRHRAPPPVALHRLSQLSDEGRVRAVQDLKVSADGASLLVSHAGGRALVYDLARVLCGGGPARSDASATGVGSGHGQGHVASIPAAASQRGVPQALLTGMSPDRPVISACADSRFRYDALAGHARCMSGRRTRMCFSRCGRFVLGGSGDGMAYVWTLPQRPHERWQGCITGLDILPSWALFGDGIEEAPCEVAWGGGSGGFVSDATRLAVGGNDGVVRVWRSSPAARDRGAGKQRMPCNYGEQSSADGATWSRRNVSRFEASTGRSTDGADRFVALPYADQPRRHLPQGGLLSRVTVPTRSAAAPRRPQQQWSQHSVAITASESEAAEGGSFRDPPALIRHQLPASLQLRGEQPERGDERLGEDASDAPPSDVIDAHHKWPPMPGSSACVEAAVAGDVYCRKQHQQADAETVRCGDGSPAAVRSTPRGLQVGNDDRHLDRGHHTALGARVDED